MNRKQQPAQTAMPQGASMGQTSSAPDRSTSALRPLDTLRFLIVAGAIALSLGVAYVVEKRDPSMEQRRGSIARRKGRRARRRERVARIAREVSIVRWLVRLNHGTPEGAELHDNAWRGTCPRCGDRMGSVHECRDLAR